MRRVLATLIGILVLGGTLLVPPAHATAAGACPLWKAQRDVKRAEARLAEARRVLAATERYGRAYGANVSRWTRLARRVGWQWPQLPTLMYVIRRESNGLPDVFNAQGSGAAGLLQLVGIHYAGRFDPTVPRANLSYGLKLYRGSGWAPWSL